ncbi:hypothetical protein QJS04_geneDACA010036 [Acorus gramineus]|uniref:Uncharacterized protein n=1 Tax=Acorus gramineus TaxID=55184 RepID=A0AAV9BI94_ACOGR|nr:hypothetical protein QJS04_geneDACA010036 [Acorus gramineus]
MASFEEEERLVQMVHDFSEPSSITPTTHHHHLFFLLTTPYPSLHQLEVIIGSSTDGEMEVLERVVKHLSEMGRDYEYIDIVMVGGSSSTRLIVDADFKSQFELVRPTRAYTELSNTLPDIYLLGMKRS